MWIKRFLDNVNEEIEKDKRIISRRKFFFISGAAAIVAPLTVKVVQESMLRILPESVDPKFIVVQDPTFSKLETMNLEEYNDWLVDFIAKTYKVPSDFKRLSHNRNELPIKPRGSYAEYERRQLRSINQ